MGLFVTNYSFDKPTKFLRCMDSPSNLKAATSFDGLEVLLAKLKKLFKNAIKKQTQNMLYSNAIWCLFA